MLMTTLVDFFFYKKNFLQQHQELCPNFFLYINLLDIFPPKNPSLAQLPFFMLFSASSVAFLSAANTECSLSRSLSLPP